jgi:hypothetical protein
LRKQDEDVKTAILLNSSQDLHNCRNYFSGALNWHILFLHCSQAFFLQFFISLCISAFKSSIIFLPQNYCLWKFFLLQFLKASLFPIRVLAFPCLMWMDFFVSSHDCCCLLTYHHFYQRISLGSSESKVPFFIYL